MGLQKLGNKGVMRKILPVSDLEDYEARGGSLSVGCG